MFVRASMLTTLVSLVAVGTGCATDEDDTGADEFRSDLAEDLSELDPARSSWEGTAEGVGLIEFVNDEATTFDLLDKTVGLDRRAAGNIVAHRDGGDRLWGSTDDDVYNTVDELDAVRFVGPRSLDRMWSTQPETAGFPVRPTCLVCTTECHSPLIKPQRLWPWPTC